MWSERRASIETAMLHTLYGSRARNGWRLTEHGKHRRRFQPRRWSLSLTTGCPSLEYSYHGPLLRPTALVVIIENVLSVTLSVIWKYDDCWIGRTAMQPLQRRARPWLARPVSRTLIDVIQCKGSATTDLQQRHTEGYIELRIPNFEQVIIHFHIAIVLIRPQC